MLDVVGGGAVFGVHHASADAIEDNIGIDIAVFHLPWMRLGAEALTGIGNGGRSTVVRLAGRERGGLCGVLRGTNIIAFFAKYLSSFTLRKVSYSASLFSAIWKIRQFVICQKRFKCQNNFDCLLIICKFAGNPMESHGGGVFSACKQKPFSTTPQGRDREDWGIP